MTKYRNKFYSVNQEEVETQEEHGKDGLNV
jgi:hypothetical protein